MHPLISWRATVLVSPAITAGFKASTKPQHPHLHRVPGPLADTTIKIITIALLDAVSASKITMNDYRWQ